MGRPRKDAHQDEATVLETNTQGKDLPETKESGDTAPGVRDLPPANPLGEPVKPADQYADVSEAGKLAAALGVETEEMRDVSDYVAGETVVEHPLSPTDANPNPHGQRSEPDANVVVETDDKGRETRKSRDEADMVEVTGSDDLPAAVHIGDGRTLGRGQSMKVDKDTAKILRDNKQVK